MGRAEETSALGSEAHRHIARQPIEPVAGDGNAAGPGKEFGIQDTVFPSLVLTDTVVSARMESEPSAELRGAGCRVKQELINRGPGFEA